MVTSESDNPNNLRTLPGYPTFLIWIETNKDFNNIDLWKKYKQTEKHKNIRERKKHTLSFVRRWEL